MPNNYVLLERIELNASAASVTFSNIPQTGYTDLKVVISARSSYSSGEGVLMRFNGSSGANYTYKQLYGAGSSVGSYGPPSLETYGFVGSMGGTNYTASTFDSIDLYIPNYTSSNNKSFSVDSVAENNSATVNQSDLIAGLWSQTAAITSITFTSYNAANFVQYSTFSLYGLAAVGTTPAIAPKATGGDRIDYDGTYWIHTFNSSGTFTPQTTLSCDYLVVAGGGGAGYAYYSGGGAAGGYRTASSASISVAQTVTIGAGGAGGTSGTHRGTNGVDSSIIGGAISTTSTGGGAGGSYNNVSFNNGNAGGSGGGGSSNSGVGGLGNTPSTSPLQGYAGGTGNGNRGGGGGGSSAVGADAGAGTTVMTAGGAGTANSISGSSVTYAAGGQGSGDGGQAAAAGTVNTGNGGGAAAIASTVGGAGGAGVVIIRYLAA
jgi:hypothetical protein